VTLQDDANIFGFELEEVNLLKIKRVFREIILLHHPDKGGDAAKFQEIREAFNRLNKYLTTPQRCKFCEGTGKEEIQKGFKTFYIICKVCRGEGKTIKS